MRRWGPGRIGSNSIRSGCLAVTWIALLVAAAGASAASIGPGQHTLSVLLSSSRAGARPVAVTAQFSYEMQCGYPGPGPVVVTFPAGERLPAGIARTAVRVDGKPAANVRLAGQKLIVGLAARPQVMCDVIGPGRLTIELTRAAKLGNPSRPGIYTLSARRGSTAFAARFTIGP